MPVLPCRRAGDPLADAVLKCRFSVQAGGHFHAQPGTAARHARDKTDVELTRIVFQQTAFGGNTRVRKHSQPAPGHLRIGVPHGRNDTHHSRGDQRFGTGRRTPMVAAGFKSNVGGGTARGHTLGMHGMDFSVRLAGFPVPAFADNRTVLDEDTTDAWIRCRRIQAKFGQTQRTRHEIVIGGAEHAGIYRLRRCAGRDTSRTSSENSSTSSKFR